jgi:hypothetical protein
MDSGADSHMTSTIGNLISSQPPSSSTPSSIVVGNGSLLPVTSTGHTFFSTPNCPLPLSHILVSPHIIKKKFISVCQFTTDNQVSVEFDLYGLCVKDLHTRNEIIRCNSSERLYPLFTPTSSPLLALLAGASSSKLWDHRLSHHGFEALSCFVPSCNKLELETHVMPVSLSSSHFLHHACTPPITLILYIMISGPLRFLVFQVTSITLLFLTTTHTTFVPFHPILNLTPSKHCQIFLPMLKPNSVAPSKVFSAIMGVNLIIPPPVPSSSAMTSPCISPTPTLLLRMGDPSVLFIQLMILCALSFFRLAFQLLIGRSLYAPPHICSTCAPRKPYLSPHRTLVHS